MPLRCLTASSAPRMPSAPPAANGPSSVASRPILTGSLLRRRAARERPQTHAATAAPTSVRMNILFICFIGLLGFLVAALLPQG